MAPEIVAQLAATIFFYMSDLPRLARMQKRNVEVEGAVTHRSPEKHWRRCGILCRMPIG